MGTVEGISSKELQNFNELLGERAMLRGQDLEDILDNLLGERINSRSHVESELELDIDLFSPPTIEQGVKSKNTMRLKFQLTSG